MMKNRTPRRIVSFSAAPLPKSLYLSVQISDGSRGRRECFVPSRQRVIGFLKIEDSQPLTIF